MQARIVDWMNLGAPKSPDYCGRKKNQTQNTLQELNDAIIKNIQNPKRIMWAKSNKERNKNLLSLNLLLSGMSRLAYTVEKGEIITQ